MMGKLIFLKKILDPTDNSTPEVVFCTDSFSRESHVLMQKWFKEKWNIATHMREKQLKTRMGYRLIVDSISVYDLFALVKPHIHSSMMYKVDFNAYVEYRRNKGNVSADVLDRIDSLQIKSTLTMEEIAQEKSNIITTYKNQKPNFDHYTVRKMYIVDGLSDSEIGDIFSKGKVSVWRQRKIWGIENRHETKSNKHASVNRKFHITLEEAQAMKAEGLTFKDIAVRMGCSVLVAKRRFEELGLCKKIARHKRRAGIIQNATVEQNSISQSNGCLDGF